MLGESGRFVTMEPAIDAHQHFWRLARGDYGWLTPALAPLYRDFEPADLVPHLEILAISRAITVQAAPTVAETRFLLDLADATPWIAGVVGWVDFESETAASEIDALREHPKLVGVRPMIQDLPDPEWMLRPDVAPAFAALERSGLRFDALVRPEHLGPLRRLLGRYPGLATIVDHAAKPPIAAGKFEPWASDLSRIATETGAWCKLSGLVTEAEPDWKVDSLRRTVDHLLESFGSERLAWGSDWPVVELAGGYAAWRAASLELLAGLAPDERSAILGGNAVRFYGLEKP
jgi:L-fuconolactonase